MLDPSEIDFSDAGFSGQARLFPLPNLVMFPHVVQPLHIFEDRYRQMMRDALAGDKLLTMCLLAPGWEPHYEGRPAVHPIACLGQIVSWHKQEDGCYNLLLAGLRRVRIIDEHHGGAFRQAAVEICRDVTESGELRQEELRQLLAATFGRMAVQSASAEYTQELRKLFETSLPLAALTDILAFTLPFPLEVKQELLAETRVDHRALRLLRMLEHKPLADDASTPRKFPPDFSEN